MRGALCCFLCALSAQLAAADSGVAGDAGARSAKLASQADAMWSVSWGRFFSPKTNLFYDFVSSYKTDGSQFAHLPTREEAEAHFPNTSGTGTGMEDGMILAGIALDAVVNRFEVEKTRR